MLETFAFQPDFSRVEVTFKRRVQPLNSQELDALIAQLGELRARLQPPITTDQAQVTTAHPVADVYFRHMGGADKGVPVRDGALLLFQSPRFGWFQLPASPGLCAGMAKWLLTGDAEGAAPG